MTASQSAVAKPVASKPAATASVQPIPFRKDSITSTPEVFGLMLTTLLVVAVFSALAWYARRRGWLDRWVGQMPQSIANNKKIVVIETQRISQKTTLYRISNGDSEYLLAESTAQIQLSPHAKQKEPASD